MLKVNVGLSRKVSRDFNSTGFSLNLEGELCVGPDDPEMMIEKIKEFYDLAEEALNQQVERYEGESAIAVRDQSPPSRPQQNSNRVSNGNGRTQGNGTQPAIQRNGNHAGNGNRGGNGNGGDFTSASNKQISYITNLAKRQGLTTPQLRKRVAEILGREVDLYDLSKDEAGIVLDELTVGNNAPVSRRR